MVININETPIEWAQRSLLENGYTINASPKLIRAMPWSKVTCFPTTKGSTFLKEMAPSFSLEPVLIRTLASWGITIVPSVIAVNSASNCYLMKDAGVVLRDHSQGIINMDLYSQTIEAYTRIQLESVPHIDDLLSIGVPDWRLKKLPDLFAHLSNQEEILLSDGLTRTELHTLQSLRPQVSILCELLCKYDIPETLEHGDFHDNNILIREGHLTLADWGDAVISHPFFSLATFLESLKRHYGLTESDKMYSELQITYSNLWSSYASKNRLIEAFQITKRLRPLQFSLNCCRAKTSEVLESDFIFKGYISRALKEFIKTELK